MSEFSPPNILSMSRLAAAPVLAFVFWLPLWTSAPAGAAHAAAAAVFGLAALTDLIDGYWARKYRQQTRFGMFLDPAADKILVATALLLLLSAGKAAAAACLLIVGREIFVSALREWAALGGVADALRVSAAGKWKTAAQMVAAPCLFAAEFAEKMGGEVFGAAVWRAGEIFLWAAAALAAWSMAEYCRAAWKARGGAKL